MKRVSSIDATRGIVMIIMALDHTRDLLHVSSLTQQPTDLATTTPLLFFTRFITHLCAPSFVFLAGVSAFLSGQQYDFHTNRRYLLTRGLVLMLLEFTLINFVMFFDVHFKILLFEVIAAIGFGFIILGSLLKLRPAVIGVIGLLIFCFHNLAASIPFCRMLFLPGAIPFGNSRLFVMSYAPIPWLGILLLGFSAGHLFQQPLPQRRKSFLALGIALPALFLLLRVINQYGDTPWTKQENGMLTFLSFFNVTKYPPSLQFCLLMLGGMCLILYFTDGVKNRLIDIVSVYGKVPLFYFIVHFFIIHIILFIMVFLQGYRFADLVFGFNFGRPNGPSGVGLPAIYLLWLLVVIMMFPLCRWYGKYKQVNKQKNWVRYL